MAKNKVVFNEYDQDQRLLLAKQRKKKRIRRFFKRLFLVLVLVAIASYFLSGFSKIMTVTVAGDELVDSDLIVELSQVETTKSFYLFTRESTVVSRLMASGYFDEVQVEKSLDRNLTITVSETALICFEQNEAGSVAINENGMVYQITGEHQALLSTLPALHDFTEEIIAQFATEYALIPSQVRYQISDIYFIPEDGDPLKCQFNMDDGKILYVRIDQMAAQLADNKYLLNIQKNPDYTYYDYVGKFIYME